MKNFRIFAAILAATALFASCQKDGGDGVKEGDPTYAGVSILLKSEGTTTRVTQAGNNEESAISSVTVYVIDDNSGRMDTKTFTSTDFVADGANTGYRKANAAIPTTVGAKTVYVVANAPTALNNLLTTVPALKNEVLALDETNFITATSGAYDGTAAKLFNVVMSGKSASNVGAQNATAALATPVQVTLTRNVAKIAVKQPATLNVANATVSDLQFGIAAKAKKSYLVSQTNTALNTLPGAPIAANYWTDNFSGRTGLNYVAVNANNTAATAANAWFALEHTPATFVEGNTTKIVIRATFVPKNLITGYASGVLTEVTNNATAADFYVHKATQKAFNAAAYAAAIADATNAATYGADKFSAKYAGGKSYYQVNIKAGQGGAKGVIRNNYYELTISGITGFGDPTEDGGITDPTTIVPDDSNIAVTLKVSDWEFIQWGEVIQ